MDKDRIKGKAKDIAGRVERQAGEWTGSEEHQVKGAAEQVKGKAQHAWGKMKDAGRDVVREMRSDDEGEIPTPDENLDRDADVDISQQNIKPRKRRAA
ncbi:MAG TPA: CsbD family protein [Terriglobales bacterium]|nr:CsbD family protein [Terriglobales bacterium]